MRTEIDLSDDQIGPTLLKAARLIEERGLCKYVREDHKGRLCLHGALALVLTEYSSICTEHEMRLARLIKDKLMSQGQTEHMDDYHGIACWNNDPKRTKEEVVQALRDTADMDDLI